MKVLRDSSQPARSAYPLLPPPLLGIKISIICGWQIHLAYSFLCLSTACLCVCRQGAWYAPAGRGVSIVIVKFSKIKNIKKENKIGLIWQSAIPVCIAVEHRHQREPSSPPRSGALASRSLLLLNLPLRDVAYRRIKHQSLFV